MKTTTVDQEWIDLMMEAIELGLTPDEVEAFINELKENPHAIIRKFN